jgi:hypothetical protein
MRFVLINGFIEHLELVTMNECNSLMYSHPHYKTTHTESSLAIVMTDDCLATNMCCWLLLCIIGVGRIQTTVSNSSSFVACLSVAMGTYLPVCCLVVCLQTKGHGVLFVAC